TARAWMRGGGRAPAPSRPFTSQEWWGCARQCHHRNAGIGCSPFTSQEWSRGSNRTLRVGFCRPRRRAGEISSVGKRLVMRGTAAIIRSRGPVAELVDAPDSTFVRGVSIGDGSSIQLLAAGVDACRSIPSDGHRFETILGDQNVRSLFPL